MPKDARLLYLSSSFLAYQLLLQLILETDRKRIEIPLPQHVYVTLVTAEFIGRSDNCLLRLRDHQVVQRYRSILAPPTAVVIYRDFRVVVADHYLQMYGYRDDCLAVRKYDSRIAYFCIWDGYFITICRHIYVCRPQSLFTGADEYIYELPEAARFAVM